MHDVTLERALTAGAELDGGLRRFGGLLVAEVDDAVVVERAVQHVPRALEHVHPLEAFDRRRVVRARIDVGRAVDRYAVLQQQGLARSPGRRTAHRNARAAPEHVVIHGAHAGGVVEPVH